MSLRNVTRTAPYYHDGSIKTLTEAVTNMAEYQLPKPLTPEQAGLQHVADLVFGQAVEAEEHVVGAEPGACRGGEGGPAFGVAGGIVRMF